MSGETEVESTTVVEPSNDAAEAAQPQVSVDDFNALKATLDKQSALIDKLREHEQKSLQKEQEAIAQRQGVEGELDALESKFQARLDEVLVDSALEKALMSAGARNVDVAKKLIDRQNIKVVNGKADVSAIQSNIDGLKETESYMFKGDEENVNPLTPKPKATKVARAGEPANEDIVNKELKAATSIADLKAIIDKHNIRQ